MIRRVKLFLVGLLLVVIISACGRVAAATNDNLIQITTTIGQITNISQIVGGEHVSVAGLMGPGVDPHLYVASASDVDKLQDADIIFSAILNLNVVQVSPTVKTVGLRLKRVEKCPYQRVLTRFC